MPIATPIRALAEDRRGHIWIGTWFDGIYRYDGHPFHHHFHLLESKLITCVSGGQRRIDPRRH
jgi:ligand-binding sensor domain-containing protein